MMVVICVVEGIRDAFAWSLFLKAPHPSSTKWE